jgi:hypothetical protein
VSAARHAYGLPDPAAGEEQPRRATGFLPLLVLVVALTAAGIWFVALPALNKPAKTERSCEVVVLKTGTTRCIENPAVASKATAD